MNALIDAAFLRSRTVLLTLVMLLIFGLYAYINIPKESDPDINIPIIYVAMDLRGISPEDAERLLIRPVEQKLRSVEGVKEMRATGFLGGANVVLEFEAGFDADTALDDVREKVDEAKPDLPEAADDPTVHEVNLSLFPIITVILSGTAPERTLLKLARDLQDEIEAHPSVLEVNIGGDRDEQVDVIIDPLRVESYQLGNSQILSNLSDFNTLVAAGSIDTGQGGFNVKVPGLFETEEDIANMPLQVNGDAVVRFRDIADIRRTFVDPTGFAQYNGQRAISLEVKKRTGENIIETIEDTKKIVREMTQNWPKNVVVDFYGDRSEPIRTMLSDLQNNVISAILLVMIVVVAALGLRSAGLVGMAIPGSFLTGILVIYTIGLTVNVVVLFSLILSVGMLVDGAIVLTEYADRKMHNGFTPKEAYRAAAKRMAWPITASTATTLAAFLPLLFWPGLMGEFMRFMPITLIATLSASLTMALIFVPVLGAALSKKNQKIEKPEKDIFENITKKYIQLLKFTLRHPGKVVLAAFSSLILIYTLYGAFGRGVELFPDIEPDFAILQIHARGNFSVHEKKELVDEVEKIVLALNQETKELEGIYARAGELGQNEGSEDIIGSIQIRFGDWKTRRKADAILDDIIARSESLPGIQIEAQKLQGGPPTGKPIQIEIASRYPEKLQPVANKIIDMFHEVGDIINIEDGANVPGIEWEVIVDRTQAVKFDTTISFIGSSIQLITNGTEISSFRPDNSNDEITIVARFPEKYRTINQLDSIRITTNKGNVPISNFVEKTAKPKVGTIHRTDGFRTQTIKADVKEGILPNDKIVALSQMIAQSGIISPDIQIKFKGEDEEQKKAGDFLSKAFLIAMFLIMIILVTQFNSFYNGFLILSAVIMSTVGVLIGLLITNQPFGIVMSGVGVIALAGIVVNNNIVLIDTYDQELKSGKSNFEAIIATGTQRLRPVLLTTITTILGLMPMVLQVNINFITREVDFGSPSTQWWVQLSTGIAYGLSFATILTLIVTPCLLMLKSHAHDWKERQKDKHLVEKTKAFIQDKASSLLANKN